MADISPIANAFAVAGLADVVYRSIVQVAGLYGGYRSSSDDVARLLDDIRTLVDLTASVQDFAVKYNGSSSGDDDSRILLPQLEKILSCCEHELGQLRRSAEDVVASRDQGWLFSRLDLG